MGSAEVQPSRREVGSSHCGGMLANRRHVIPKICLQGCACRGLGLVLAKTGQTCEFGSELCFFTPDWVFASVMGLCGLQLPLAWGKSAW